MRLKIVIISTILLLGCSPQDTEESVEKGGMKCGAGKCGASMVDGSVLLVKKKMNIVNQLDQNDSRRECVLNASSTKILYDCVRDKKTKRLSLKLVKEKMETEKGVMKCAVGKCGGG
ncbi:MAG: hypothetical protein QM493_02830 [Sulfurovum sp.]